MNEMQRWINKNEIGRDSGVKMRTLKVPNKTQKRIFEKTKKLLVSLGFQREKEEQAAFKISHEAIDELNHESYICTFHVPKHQQLNKSFLARIRKEIPSQIQITICGSAFPSITTTGFDLPGGIFLELHASFLESLESAS